MAAEISIRGQVRTYEGLPIPMIKVSVYRDAELITHGYTNDGGHYLISSVPAGEPVTVRFDTHATLNNSRDWHPSVVANLEAGKDILLDRFMLKVGTNIGEVAAGIDALAAYMFAALWTAHRVDSGSAEYGKEAAARLSPLKFASTALQQIQRILITHFESAQ